RAVEEQKIAVINLLGQSGYQRVHLHNPFLLLNDLLEELSQETKIILVDFHATTTAEKCTMFYFLDGKVTAVMGSHGKVLTADAQILPGGTATICGTGRTGGDYSVGGLEPEIEIRKFLTQIHEQSKITWDNLQLQGVILEIDGNGKATSIETIRIHCEDDHDRTRNSA
ncbi:MAG TPA: YmdB family metallophosphoesterase, partial [bacterium]|nr:YmdB family metallophosphoesterase [bacterium]